jgi:hypothetical protein
VFLEILKTAIFRQIFPHAKFTFIDDVNSAEIIIGIFVRFSQIEIAQQI